MQLVFLLFAVDLPPAHDQIHCIFSEFNAPQAIFFTNDNIVMLICGVFSAPQAKKIVF